MRAQIVPHPNSKYTAEQIEVGLTAIALELGNCAAAARMLKQLDPDNAPDAQRLRDWKRAHPERLSEIRAEQMHRIKGKLADQHGDLAARNNELEQEALALLSDRVADMSDRDLINLVRTGSFASSQHTDKAQLLRGEATMIVQRELPEVVRALAAKGIVIEGHAEEVQENGNDHEPAEAEGDAPEATAADHEPDSKEAGIEPAPVAP
jgi:hypothetical protein